MKATNLALLATDRDTERAEALINEMIGEARKLVEQHWPDIETLAQRLLVEGRVNFLQLKAGGSGEFRLLVTEGCASRKPAPTTGGLKRGCSQSSRTPKNVWSYPKSRHLCARH